MANDWRGYRTIALGGLRLRWMVDFNHPAERFSVGYAERGASWPPDRLLVRPETDPHRRLTVCWSACRGPVITPALVRTFIDEAQRRGWPETSTTLVLSGAEVPISDENQAEQGVAPDRGDR